MLDAVVIGAGPNGLVAAAELARHGWQVLVLEAKARPGGALYTEELTLAGYRHDVGAAFFPFATASPAFRALDLTGAGVGWCRAAVETCHPAPDGTSVGIYRDVAAGQASFGATDGPAWRQLATWAHQMGDSLVSALLAPLPGLAPAWRLGPAHLSRLAWQGVQSPAGWARRQFQTEAARRVIPALALHVDLGPEDAAGAGLGLVLALLATLSGFVVPRGGARSITDALISRLVSSGGAVRLNSRVHQLVVRQGRAVAVRTAAGEEIEFRRAVVADVGPAALFLRLLRPADTAGWVRAAARRFRYAWGTFKLDWALSGPVPWLAAEARSAAVVHTGDSIDDLIQFTRQVRAGELPSNPYLVIGQQSLIDPSRAPPGGHTLWAYSHVPAVLANGWRAHRESFADRVERRIERLAPGFRAMIRARAIHAPPDLEAMDENLVDGDLGGGSAHFRQQLFLRPFFPFFRHRTPITGIYLGSASTHPGAGVHGACGFNAAHAALFDAGQRPQATA